MPGKQVTELDALPTFTDTSLLPVHNGAGLKKGTLSQLTDYIAERFSNPNLLLNSNFRVDQRGRGTYTNNTTRPMYTLDRWMSINTKVVYNVDGTATITSLDTTDSGNVKYKFSDIPTIELSKYSEITLLTAPLGVSQQNMTVIFDEDSYVELDAEVYA